ncbi:hypothetical protein [Rhodovulum sp. YEN HP10]|uniref:hypothetical protein n=1 Tax=Rhodovulum sp. HP10 TaxID=3387397 RepID=UPI0039E043D3
MQRLLSWRAPRDRWLTCAEAARLLRAARNHPKSRHLAPFILVALYTGTRKEAILALRFAPHTLKHTAVTWAMHKGVPLADAAGFFGTTVATLESVYLHHHPSFQEATAKALDGWK